MKYLKTLVVLAVLIFSGQSFAETIEGCSTKFTAFGLPTGPQNIKTTNLCRKAYIVRHYDACKTPLLVTQLLVPGDIGGVEPRVSFHPDLDLQKSARALPSDYRNSGYDMGHLAPAADFKTDKEEMFESFKLSNASPQAPRMNRGVWRLIEMRVRALTVKNGELYVYTGVIYSDTPKKIGNNVCVGDYYYKIVIDKKANTTLAFLVKNTEQNLVNNPDSYVTTIENIEKLSGINFMTNFITKPKVQPKFSEDSMFLLGPLMLAKLYL